MATESRPPESEYPIRPPKPEPWWYTSCALAFFLFAAAFVVHNWMTYGRSKRPKTIAVSCLSNVKQMGVAIALYSEDYDETLPASERWMDAIQHEQTIMGKPLVSGVFHCPAVAGEGAGYGYAYDTRLSAQPLSNIPNPESTMLLYDSTRLNRNASDPGTSIAWERHGKEGCSIGFADGHAKLRRPGDPLLPGKAR